MACVAKKEKPKRHQMTDEWKTSVDVALAAKDWTRADLARQIGVHKTVVSAMLGRQNVSALVPRVCEVLGIPMPVIGVSAVRTELEALFENLTPEDQETVLALARRLAK